MSEINNEHLVETAVFGKQCEQFLESDIGIYLLARAEQESFEATQKLKVINWDDQDGIRRLQNKIYVAESFKVWMTEAIHQGKQALKLIEEE